MNDFLKSIDAIFYGRKSYELVMKTEGRAIKTPRTSVVLCALSVMDLNNPCSESDQSHQKIGEYPKYDTRQDADGQDNRMA